MKTLIIYVYHEYTHRVGDFISKTMFEDPDFDWILVSNGCASNISLPSYCHFIQRDNIGFDFGGWGQALASVNLSEYTYLILANSSISTPHLPVYASRWPSIFTSRLSEEVKLVGPTINCGTDPYNFAHVQSYLVAMEISTLELLKSEAIFTTLADNFGRAIGKEVRMSRCLIEQGYNIASLQTIYQDKDFRVCDFAFYSVDVMTPLGYLHRVWSPQEIVFFKANRHIVIGPSPQVHHLRVWSSTQLYHNDTFRFEATPGVWIFWPRRALASSSLAGAP